MGFRKEKRFTPAQQSVFGLPWQGSFQLWVGLGADGGVRESRGREGASGFTQIVGYSF